MNRGNSESLRESWEGTTSGKDGQTRKENRVSFVMMC